MTNDQIILDQVLEQKKKDLAPTLSDSEYFEVFVAEQVLKDSDLSYEELEDGIVGDGGDGGVDAIYVFANGELVREDSDFTSLKRGVLIEVVVVQAKRSAGFGEAPLDRLNALFSDLFDLGREVSAYAAVYNESVRSAVTLFRTVYQSLAARFPKLRFRIVYGSKGTDVHPNVARKGGVLKERIETLYSAADVSVEFVGAAQLWELARTAPSTSFTLTLAEAPISASGDVGFIALARLKDFFTFITDAHRNLRKTMFEANVRDYQGATQVNEEIQQTLKSDAKEDFWWLNNGVTVVASKAVQSGKMLTIEDPQIVNGLQTSTEIYKYFKDGSVQDDPRHLLVRAIVPRAEESRDRVIKATNSQTYVSPASLRATDKIQRDIEQFLLAFNLYYDRRKNFYKNDGKPLERIVSISLMAQAVMAVLLQRPNDARARPSSLLKENADYEQIFSEKIDIHTYRACIELLKLADGYLRAHVVSGKDRNNLRFYVAARLACELTGKLKPAAADLCALKLESLDPAALARAYPLVAKEYERLGGTDQVAKGPELRQALEAIPVETAK